MADLSVELANLNSNARELLDKYDGAFNKLEERKNEILGEISNGVIMTDRKTNTRYRLFVEDGEIKLEVAE